MKFPRSSGILLHPTCFPGTPGIGTLGTWAHRWLDFLADAGQTVWQVLPLGPTGYGDSPYQSYSSHAGNIYLIDLDQCIEQGLLTQQELGQVPERPPHQVDYCLMYEWKRPLLYQMASHFQDRASEDALENYRQFCAQKGHWLEDFALFMACKEAHEGRPWTEWPKPLKTRSERSLTSFVKKNAEMIENQKVLQFLFFEQWSKVRQYANERRIRILGDLPIFVALDSADAWVCPELFHFDEELALEVVAGVPPDYFSADGQLWGNPLYRWDKHKKTGYKWWLQRLSSALELYDMLRVDHFRGFEAYWEVPAGEETARNGRWVKGPGSHFFKKVLKEFPDTPIVAEDLGDISDEVRELRDQFELPGMLVLQFAFGGGPDNAFLPHHHEKNFVVYTGTHDNDTTLGWYVQSASQEERGFFHQYCGNPRHVVQTVIRLALNSCAHTAIVPFQDWLGLGSPARMNTPSEASRNWQWRFPESLFTRQLMQLIRTMTYASDRFPKT